MVSRKREGGGKRENQGKEMEESGRQKWTIKKVDNGKPGHTVHLLNISTLLKASMRFFHNIMRAIVVSSK